MRAFRKALVLLLALCLLSALSAAAFADGPTLVGEPTVQTDAKGREIFREEHWSDGSTVTATTKYLDGTQVISYYTGNIENLARAERTVDTTAADGSKTRRLEYLAYWGKVMSTTYFELDAQGRQVSGVSESQYASASYSYAYNADGSYTETITSYSYVGGSVQTRVRQFSAQGLVQRVDVSIDYGDGINSETTVYQYDANGNMLRSDTTSGSTYTDIVNSASVVCTYSDAGKLQHSVETSTIGSTGSTEIAETDYNAEGYPVTLSFSSFDAEGEEVGSFTGSYTYWENGAPKTFVAEREQSNGGYSYQNETQYNELGRPTVRTTTNSYGQGSVNTSVTEYTYDEQGLSLLSLHYEQTSNGGAKNVRDEIYNELELVTSSTSGMYYRYGAGEYYLSYSTESSYTYNALGKVLTESSVRTDGTGAVGESSQVSYTYAEDGRTRVSQSSITTYGDGSSNSSEITLDAQGRDLTSVVTQRDPNGNVSSIHEYAYTYGGNGKLSQSVETRKDPAGEVLTVTTTDLTYNSAGRQLTEETVTQDADGAVVYSSSRETVYGEDGKTCVGEQFEEHQSDGSSSLSVYEYNEMGAIVHSLFSYWDAEGQLSSTQENTRTYDQNGHALSNSSVIKDAEGNIISSNTDEYMYNDSGIQYGYRTERIYSDGVVHRWAQTWDPSNGHTLSYDSYDRYSDGREFSQGYAYDENGNLLSSYEEERDADGTVLRSETTEVSYDEDGSRTEIRNSAYSDGRSASSQMQYDANDRLLSGTSYVYKADGELSYFSTSSSSFEEDGSYCVQTITGLPGAEDNHSITEYYDADGVYYRRIECDRWEGGVTTWQFDYDGQGRTVSEHYVYYSGEELIEERESTFTYSDDGSVTKHTEWPSGAVEDNTAWYAENGEERYITRQLTVYTDAAGRTQETETLYDSSGNPTSSTVTNYDEEGNVISTGTTSYIHGVDEDGAFYTELTVYDTGASREHTQYFDEDGNTTRSIDTDITAGGDRSVNANYYENDRNSGYSYDYRSGDQSYHYHNEYSYDEQGREVSGCRLTEYSDGSVSSDEWSRVYNDDGSYTQTDFRTENGRQWTVVGEYTADGELISETASDYLLLNLSNSHFYTGEQVWLSPTLNAPELDDQTLTYSTNDPAVFTVAQNGLLTAQGKGVAVLSVWANGDPSLSDQALIFVGLDETVSFSGSLTAIEEEACCGSGVEYVEIGSLTSIGARAFADCASLRAAVFGSAELTIADDAFDNCPNLRIVAPADSAGERYAISHDICCYSPDGTVLHSPSGGLGVPDEEPAMIPVDEPPESPDEPPTVEGEQPAEVTSNDP